MMYSENIFFGVFPIVLAIYYLLRWERAQAAFLVFISILFMATFGWYDVLIAAGVASFVAAGSYALRKLGVGAQWPIPIALLALLVGMKLTHQPIGISYYIFIILSVFWFLDGQVPFQTAIRSIFFLPHIVAGPISSGQTFYNQLASRKSLHLVNMRIGIGLLLLGYFKKTFIADPIALSTAPVWAEPKMFSGSSLSIAVLAFYIQLYADFSGYTDMARGIGRLFGYRLPINFRGPYLSATPIEFWSRWHISLSNWIRENFYMPLSMVIWRRVKSKRLIAPATLLTVMTVMGVVGLWHEFSVRFLVFGLLHGLLIGIWYAALGHNASLTGAKWWLNWAAFQSLLIASLVMFRAPTWESIAAVFQRIFSGAEGQEMAGAIPGLLIVAALTFLFQIFEYTGARRAVASKIRPLRNSFAVFPAFVALLIIAIFFKGLSLEGVWVAPNDPFFHSEHVRFIYAKF